MFGEGGKRERERAKTLQYIHNLLNSLGGKDFSIYLLRMVIFLQYTEECHLSMICFANNTVAISKNNSSIKYSVFPTIMKYIHCVATNRSCYQHQQRQVLSQTLMVLIHSLTIHNTAVVRPLWLTAEEVVLLCSLIARLGVSS